MEDPQDELVETERRGGRGLELSGGAGLEAEASPRERRLMSQGRRAERTPRAGRVHQRERVWSEKQSGKPKREAGAKLAGP